MLEISSIGIFAAFAAGVVSFLSPCVLPLVPGYLSYIAGQPVQEVAGGSKAGTKAAVLALGSFFVLGFATVFVALGASATALGQLLLAYRYEANILAGAVVIAFGLVLIGLLKLSWLQRDLRFHLNVKGGRPVAAYVLGLAFAFGWTPCIGPVLGAILTVAAAQASVTEGMTLLAIYSLGLGIPFLVAAAFAGAFVGWLRAMRRLGRVLQAAAGVVLVVMGAAMITGRLSEFSYWLLDLFPALATIG